MSFKGDLSTIGLAEVFQMISLSQKDGTLVVQDAESRKAIYFSRDGVQLHSAGPRRGFKIGDILVRAGKINVGQLRDVLDRQQVSKRLLGEELVARGLVSEQDIRDVVRTQIEEEIYDLFLWRKATFEFIEGPPVEELQDSECRSMRLSFDVNSLLLEAVRRADEWTLINQKIPSMDGVYVFTNTGVREEELKSVGEQTRVVLECLDGQTTLSEIIERSFVPRFEVCRTLIDLLDRGCVRPLNVDELLALAGRWLEEGKREKGLKVFAVAAQLAPEEAELLAKYAHALEKEGMVREAARMYVRVGNFLKQQGQMKDALAYFQRAISLNSEDVQSKIALFEIQLASAGIEEAMATAGELVAACLRERDYDMARQVAERAVTAAPQNLELRLALAKVYHALGKKAERDEVVQFLRKNLPVDQAAADKIISELREIADPVSGTTTEVTNVPVRRQTLSPRAKLVAWVMMVFVGMVGVGGFSLYEMWAQSELDRRIGLARERELEQRWDEAAELLRGFERSLYRFSLFSKGRLQEELASQVQRRREHEVIVNRDRKPPVSHEGEERERREREEALLTIRLTLDELVRSDAAGRYDEALSKAQPLQMLAEKWGEKEAATKAKEVYDRLAPQDRAVRNLRGVADRLEAEGKFKEACAVIEQLHRECPSWKVAAEAPFPFALDVQPAGVRVLMRQGQQSWPETPLLISKGTHVVLHLPYRHGRFQLRGEKAGFQPVEVTVADERAGEARIHLLDRVPLDQGPLGASALGDPLVMNGRLFLFLDSSGQRRLYAMEAGRRLNWDVPADTAATLGPGGSIFFGVGERILRADVNGQVNWEYEAGARVNTSVGVSASGDRVFFGTGAKVSAVDISTRKLLWSHELPEGISAGLGIGEGLIFAAGSEGTLYGCDAQGIVDKTITGGAIRHAPLRVDYEEETEDGRKVRHGIMVVGSADGRIYAVDVHSATLRWRGEVLPGEVEGRPCALGDAIFAGATDGTVVCVSVRGEERWRCKPGGLLRAGLAASAGCLVIGDSAGMVYALDAGTGRVLWRFLTRAAIRVAPVISEGRVFVVSEDKNLYVLPLE